MKKLAPFAALALIAAGAATAATPLLLEQRLANQEERLVITSPIAGIANSRWYDYRSDIGEAKKELASDLRRASDLEDTRDAWEEYTYELKGERHEYVRYMAKRGYRYGTVTFER